jgi:hypothetical protein
MALHTGDVDQDADGYRGLVLHRAARLLVAAHGGQILCSEATAALLRRDPDPEFRLRDLGIYRLRDAPEPERLFQVEYPGMARRELSPPNAEAGYAGNLPLQLNRFLGREAELAGLTALLAPVESERGGEWENGRRLAPTPLPLAHSPTRPLRPRWAARPRRGRP